MPSKLVFGMGSGRCGTVTLAQLLQVTHEAVPLPWDADPIRLAHAVRSAVRNGGDVGMTWLRFVRFLIPRFPKARFVCLKREKEATCKSWRANLGDRTRLFFPVLYEHEGRIHWGNTFPPQFEDLPIELALSAFYDLYYQMADTLARDFPDRFRIYPSPHVLNDRFAQMDMKRFAHRSRLPYEKLHRNAMESLEDAHEREARRVKRRLHARLYDIAAEHLIGGGDPRKVPEFSKLVEKDPSLLELFREVIRLTQPDADPDALRPEDMTMDFGRLPIGAGYKGPAPRD